jgi:hypothetical protein
VPQKDDKLKSDGFSTDDFVSVSVPEELDKDGIAAGSHGGGDVYESDGARYVLIEKVRDDGIPYMEQVHPDDLQGDEKIVAEESGANANAVREPHETVSGQLRGLTSSKQKKS